MGYNLYMQNRSTKKTGEFRKKRGDTKMGSIEKKYGKDFGVRSEKKLANYLNEKGYRSLSDLLKNG
ncbi:hypothetical protein HQ524_04470 [Candidatus Uhrbacteria bacterium]|nr:hypothetical protein [Candidatus Uhrbacteria bacterium]